tara:strand:- start:122 stop:640 length:519 start_codon:yes stop_codon:yes gene_type:complete
MDINQLLLYTFLVYLFINYRKKENTEGFNGEITTKTCIQRILNYECMDVEKRELLNEDCNELQINTPSGLSNISCEDKDLFNTLICNKMISEGACDCDYGRKQIANSCNIAPLFIRCPSELKAKDLELVKKFKSLNSIVKKCNIEKTTTTILPYVITFIIIGIGLIILFYRK